MSKQTNPGYSDEDYDGFVGAGLPAGVPVPALSEEELRWLEEARNDPGFYELLKDKPFVSAGYVPPPVDPNRTLRPSREELAKLPRWARVAFAARCARRILPSARTLWTDTFKRHLPGLDRVVCGVERAATAASLTAAAIDAAAIDAIFSAASSENPADYVAGVAYSAVTTATSADDADSTAFADAAVADTLMGLARLSTVGTVNILAAPAVDFERLRWRAAVEKWTDDTPVSPAVFGPMWDGPPPSWWTNDVLAGLPPEPAAEVRAAPNEEQPAPSNGAVAPH